MVYLAHYKKKTDVAAPTTRVEGVVAESAGAYALMDDHGQLWWFDNHLVVCAFHTLNGPDYHVEDVHDNHVDLSVYPFQDSVYMDPTDGTGSPQLKAQPGERVSFVPRVRSTLRFRAGKLVIHECMDVHGHTRLESIPSACVGVATETRPATHDDVRR